MATQILDGKAISFKLTGAEFRVVAIGPEHADLGVLDHREVGDCLPGNMQRDVLAGDCEFIFLASDTDCLLGCAEMFGEKINHVTGGHFLFLDKQKDVLAAARRVEERLFFNEEVFGSFADDAADAVDFLGEVRGGCG